MGTAEWLSARNVRRRNAEERTKNIFKGSFSQETARVAGVPIVRLNVWMAGTKAPPHSYALVPPKTDDVLLDDVALATADSADDFEGIDDDWDKEDRRAGAVDNSKEFEELESDEIPWKLDEKSTLPFNIEWQQSAESRWELFFDLPKDAICMGLGERNTGLNLRSAVHTLFNTDDPLHIESLDAMYKSIPFLVIQHRGEYHGIFLDSPGRQKWNLDIELCETASVELLSRRGWQLYAFGPCKLPELLAAYSTLTGRSKLPPLWSLGHQQSRWSYPDQDTVVRLAHEFRSRSIPCDTIVLDIDYMDEYRVFTHSPTRFPDFKNLISDLGNNNFKVVTIIDPGVKKDAKYFTFTDGKKHNFFCTRSDGKLFIDEVWPGPSAFPDFLREEVRTWWAAMHGFYTENGVAGIWNDMNEPSLFRTQKPLDHKAAELPPESKQLFMQQTPDGKVGHFEVRNLYGFQMCRATYEGLQALRPNERTFILTRSAFAGIQRYSAVWLGDNKSWWSHLAKSIPMLVNVGISGVPFCGVDIGGFWDDCSAELLVRWYEVGIFYPLFRNHCAMDGAPQECWQFSQEIEDHCRKLIETRYKLLPYIQRLWFEHIRTGAPLMRPMSWHYPKDDYAARIDDQFMFGEDILVAPILSRGHNARAVYLPEGMWHSFDGSQRYDGGRLHQISLPMGTVPAFVRDGAVIPFFDVIQHTGEAKESAITFHCYGTNCAGLYYEEDGISQDYEQGSYNEWRVRVDDGRFLPQPLNLGLSGWPNRDFRMRYQGKLSAVALS